VKRPLNLARHPFRNERLPTLLFLLGCAVLLGLSVRHAVAARDLLPERTAGVDGELVTLEQEVARLRSEAESLRTRSASEQALREWAVIRDLVDRRAFSWSELLGRLEGVVPAGIRLVSIAPSGAHGEIEVAVGAVGEAVEDGLEFLKALQKGREFKEPFLSSVSEGAEGIDFSYTMIYEPGPRASGKEPGRPAPDEEPGRAAVDPGQAAAGSAGKTDEMALGDDPEDAELGNGPEGGPPEIGPEHPALEGEPADAAPGQSPRADPLGGER
jgi:Tfp pilus assembly protein PilN